MCFSDQQELKQTSSESPLPHNNISWTFANSEVLSLEAGRHSVSGLPDSVYSGNRLLTKIPSVNKSLFCSVLIPLFSSNLPVSLNVWTKKLGKINLLIFYLFISRTFASYKICAWHPKLKQTRENLLCFYDKLRSWSHDQKDLYFVPPAYVGISMVLKALKYPLSGSLLQLFRALS